MTSAKDLADLATPAAPGGAQRRMARHWLDVDVCSALPVLSRTCVMQRRPPLRDGGVAGCALGALSVVCRDTPRRCELRLRAGWGQVRVLRTRSRDECGVVGSPVGRAPTNAAHVSLGAAIRTPLRTTCARARLLQERFGRRPLRLAILRTTRRAWERRLGSTSGNLARVVCSRLGFCCLGVVVQTKLGRTSLHGVRGTYNNKAMGGECGFGARARSCTTPSIWGPWHEATETPLGQPACWTVGGLRPTGRN